MTSDPASRRTERLLVTAAFTTALGNNVQLIGGALLMVRERHTMMAVGWLFIAVAAPQALLSPVLGRLADRFDRRRLWVGCDTASALLALALPVWLTAGGAQAPGVYAANFALALVAAAFVPVSAALVKERVAGARLRRFNGSYEMATQAGMLLSATVGGLAVQAFGAVPLLVVNAATFAVSALCVAATGRRAGAAPGAAAAAGPGSGRTLPVRRMILLYAQGSVVVTVFNALLPVRVLGELHRGAGTFGAVDAIGSLGFLLATAAYRRAVRRTSDLRIALVGFLSAGVVLPLQSFSVATLAAGLAVGAVLFGQARIASRSLLMASVDGAAAGRAFGLANGCGLAATIGAMLLVGTITDHTDARYGFAALGLLSALATAAAVVRLPGPVRRSHTAPGPAPSGPPQDEAPTASPRSAPT